MSSFDLIARHAQAHDLTLDGAADPVAALAALLDALSPDDAAWLVYLMAGGRPLRPAVPARVLHEAARQASGLPDWLFEASVQAAGDLPQALALLLSGSGDETSPSPGLAAWIAHSLRPLQGRTADEQIAGLPAAWRAAGPLALELAVQLSAGRWRFRPGADVIQRALAAQAGLPVDTLARRWADWYARAHKTGRPDDSLAWQALLAPPDATAAPAPERLPAWPRLQQADPALLGSVDDWLVCRDHDGWRVQLVRSPSETRLWADGARLLDAAFPELVAEAARRPGSWGLEGELLPARAGGTLQPRIGRGATAPSPTPAQIARAPARLRLHDLLAIDGEDLRTWPYARRRQRLEGWLAQHPSPLWTLADPCPPETWDGAAGLLLQRLSAGYGDDGACWRLPAPPQVVPALLLHAQAGTGRDAGLYVDCTLAVWNRRPADAAEAEAVLDAIARQAPRDASGSGLELVPLGRTAEGLGDAERRQVDRLVRATTVARHGPVRSLRPGLVLALAFDGLEASSRRRSGVVLRSPRLQGVLDGVAPHEIADLATLLAPTG
ncbi:ATP-dependent DNA ligase [Leptothrix sp. BB-4]